MRPILVLAAVAALAAGSAFAATDQQTVMKTCSNQWTGMSATDKGTTKRTDFMSKCMKAPATSAAAAAPAMTMKPAASGTMAMKPMASGSMAMTAKPAAGSMAMKPAATGSMAVKADAGGSAKCKDGATVTYKHRSGTCSGHGGVATWM
jgi:hypothetical protein